MQHAVVTEQEWLTARKALLAKEKELIHLRDRINQERQALPWVKIGKEYVFDTPSGRKTLADLFDGRSQLLIYHFMLGPGRRRAVPPARCWPTASTAFSPISRITTLHSSPSHEPRSRRSRHIRPAWDGASPGFPPREPISISTTTSHSRRNTPPTGTPPITIPTCLCPPAPKTLSCPG